jgi:hydroxyacylglutathione hydrolase
MKQDYREQAIKRLALVMITILFFLLSCTVAPNKKKEQNNIDPAALVDLMKEADAVVIDTMSSLECMDHRIPYSQCIPLEELDKRLPESFPEKKQRLIFYCESEECPRGGLAYRKAELLGYENISVLEGGIAAWKKAGYGIERVKRVKREPVISIKATKLQSLMKEKKGLLILDVRSEDVFRTDHIDNSKNMPLYVLHKRLREIPKNVPVLVVDENGRRSFLVCCYLINNGITDVTRLFGGMEAVANLEGKRVRP